MGKSAINFEQHFRLSTQTIACRMTQRNLGLGSGPTRVEKEDEINMAKGKPGKDAL
jgi:hypothetical protein